MTPFFVFYQLLKRKTELQIEGIEGYFDAPDTVPTTQQHSQVYNIFEKVFVLICDANVQCHLNKFVHCLHLAAPREASHLSALSVVS